MKMIKVKSIVLTLLLSVFLTSCGTVFNYRNSFKTKSKSINYPVLILDAAGLIFFVVPGLLALTVDYVTGNLFLKKEEETEKQKELPSTLIDFLQIENDENR